MHLSYYNNKE